LRRSVLAGARRLRILNY